MLSLTYNGKNFINWEESQLIKVGVPASLIANAVRRVEWTGIKKQRQAKLLDADYLVNTALDNGIDETLFRQYRQALRDIPQTYSNPEDVVWPQKPSF